MVEALAAQYAAVSELLKDTEEAVTGGRTGMEPAMAGVQRPPRRRHQTRLCVDCICALGMQMEHYPGAGASKASRGSVRTVVRSFNGQGLRCAGYYRYWERAFMDAMVAALISGVAQLQAIVAGQGNAPLFRVRGMP